MELDIKTFWVEAVAILIAIGLAVGVYFYGFSAGLQKAEIMAEQKAKSDAAAVENLAIDNPFDASILNPARTMPLPTARSKADLIKYVRENCARYGGVWNGVLCQKMAKPISPIDSAPAAQPKSAARTQSFLGSIIEFFSRAPRP